MAATECLSNQVVRAVQLLYGTEPQAQHEANNWLTSFSTSPEAWDVCLQLLASAQAVEVQFYSANTLLKKIREQWGALSPVDRANLQKAISEKLHSLISQPGIPHLITSRASIVLGATAVLSGDEHARELVRHALTLAASGGSVSIATELLTAIAEEVDSLHRSRRQQAALAVAANAAEVTAMVEAALAGRLGGSCGASALRCLSAWLKLDTAGAGRPLLSLRDAHAAQQGLLVELLKLLGDEEEAVAAAAADVLVELTAATTDDPKGDEQAVRMVMSGLVSHQGEIQELHGAHVGQALGRVACAVAENHSGAATGGLPEAIPLAHLMMQCLSHSERRTVEAALDYFLMLNTVPVAERHPELQKPLYIAMLGPLLRLATMPHGLEDWRTFTGDDEDSFRRFREQILTDALDNCYGLLRLEYLQSIGSMMAAADTWQKAEACLFALRCIALSVKSRILSERKADLVNPAIQAERADTSAFLLFAFSKVFESADANTVFWSHLLVIEAACRLVGAYAAWFGSSAEAPVLPALRYLLRVLAVRGHGDHGSHAAAAVRNLCARCSKALLDPPSLKGLMDAVDPVIAGQPGLKLEDRQAVVEGLARLVSLLPPGEAAQACIRLVGPLVARAHAVATSEGAQAAAAGASHEEHAAALSDELELIASAVRFMDFPGDGLEGQPHPATGAVEALWPVLSSAADSPRWSSSAAVVAAVCSVYQRCVLSLKASAAPLLQPMVARLVSLLGAGNHPPCLAALGTCAEVFGPMDDAQEILTSALSAVAERALSRLQEFSPSQLGENAEFVAATLQLADRYLLFALPPLVSSNCLLGFVGLAARALTMSEREAVQAALSFLSHVISPNSKQHSSSAWVGCSGAVVASVEAHLNAVVHGLLIAVAGTCPRHILRVLSGCLFNLTTSTVYSGAISGLLPVAVMSSDFPPVRDGLLKEEDCKRFCNAALRQSPLPRPRFDALIADFSAVCRAEGTSDMLANYDLCEA
uniref:Importin N-terminal domain-containing protein n=1 Tax=Tetraselmis sp. GSL018 TaxID=582737 RepID=A0A061RMX8_9CHLO|eukprot:CAMPEP_0177619732 /NCGR_PEP_ID=MMETSP0419_2-20121207/26451_1 /TAXON_ID=582737 /ORGANISM="Tetraselmis sp., Strain GSL018" /LENGTH=990 /DNA_ID=CAMNT_0019119087 /DNA_START=376 /DNA_END=3348 /DNA_ORIENTATION=-